MSHPLVQFASDMVAKHKNGSNLNLRLHLMTLLLTALSDVTIFGEVDAINDLLVQHACLDKCLDLVRSLLTQENPSAELKTQMLCLVTRVFKVVLEKHANHKTLRILRDTSKPSQREDLIKNVCNWFSRENGLAQTIMSGLNLLPLLQVRSALTLFADIGRVVTICGLCSKGFDETSYPQYLKETRTALVALFHELIAMAWEKLHDSTPTMLDAFIGCLVQSTCVDPQAASACALSLLSRTSQPERLMNWLADVLCHFYGRHYSAAGAEQFATATADSDSAICASDSSSSENIIQAGRKGMQKCLWTQYLELILQGNRDGEMVKTHLTGLMSRLDSHQGREHIFEGVILPLVEAKLNGNAKDDSSFHWAMLTMVKMKRLNCIPMARLYQDPERCHTLVAKLLALSVRQGNDDLGFTASRCLEALTWCECAFYAEKEIPIPPHAVFVPAIANHLLGQGTCRVEDCLLWIIQRQLLEAFPKFYSNYLLSKDVLDVFEAFHLGNAWDKSRSLYIVCQHMLAMLDTSESLSISQRLMDELLSQVSPGGKFDQEAAKVVISLMLGGAVSIDTGCDSQLPHLQRGDGHGSDADGEDESDSSEAPACVSSLKLLSPEALEKVLVLLSTPDVSYPIMELALCKIRHLVRSHLERSSAMPSRMALGETILGFLKGILAS